MFLLFAAEEMNEKLDKILEYASNLELLTQKSFWHQGTPEIIFDSMAFLASAMALGVVFTIMIKYIAHNRHKNCQTQAIGEIIRYLYVNDMIIEVIRLKMERRKWQKGCHPHEAIIRRFRFPEKDLDLIDFSISTKSYFKIREFQLFVRNYNIAVDAVAKHFEDESQDKQVKIRDLADLIDRSRRMHQRIQTLIDDFKLDIPSIEQFIINHHKGDFDPNNLELTFAEQEIVKGIAIPPHYKGIADHYRKAVADKYVKFYDIEILPLEEGCKEYEVYSSEMIERFSARNYASKADKEISSPILIKRHRRR